MDVITVPVTIENKSHLFAVDSGCMRSVVHESLRPLLKSGPIENSLFVDEIPVYWPPAMRVGSIDVDELGFVSCFDLSRVREVTGRDVEGILGIPLFEKYVIQMDFDRNHLVILPGSTDPSPDWGMPIPAPFGHVPVALDDKVVADCKIDTGSSAYIMLPFETYDKLVEQKSMSPIGENRFTSLNGTRVAQEAQIPTTKIGNFEEHNVVITRGVRQCQLGLAYLRLYQVTFDIGRNRIYLAKRKTVDPVDREADIGIGMLRKSEKTVVSAIKSKSPAVNADVHLNDEVVAVDGEVITNQPIAEIRRMMREKYYSNGAINVRLLRNGEQRTISVAKQE